MTLPYDVARCTGYMHTVQTAFGTVSTGRTDCVKCLRRTSEGHPERQTQMTPPAFIDGKCPERI